MLHPQARALLDLIAERGLPPTHTLSPAEARRTYRDRRAITQPAPPEVAAVESPVADGPGGPVPLRLYRPLGPEPVDGAGPSVRVPVQAPVHAPVLVYFHGGGWVIGDLDTHDTLCRELANLAGIVVVAVDYRLGPEHRFPAAYDDAFAATAWVAQNADRLGVDATRLAVGGDSAGGNLAAAVCLGARDAMPALRVAYQLLIYPATDMRRGHPSHVENGEGYLLTRDTIRYFHDHYIENSVDDRGVDDDWRASPLLAADHANLPPALVLTAGYDPLRDEGLDYARVLSEAGNAVSYVCFSRQIHGFVPMGRVLDEANTAVALCAAELRRALRG